MRTLVRRHLPGWRIRAGGIEFFRATRVSVTRYRGIRIPIPLGERHGMTLRRAGCSGMGTSGSEGGQQKPTSRKTGRALLSDPYTKLRGPARGIYLRLLRDPRHLLPLRRRLHRRRA